MRSRFIHLISIVSSCFLFHQSQFRNSKYHHIWLCIGSFLYETYHFNFSKWFFHFWCYFRLLRFDFFHCKLMIRDFGIEIGRMDSKQRCSSIIQKIVCNSNSYNLTLKDFNILQVGIFATTSFQFRHFHKWRQIIPCLYCQPVYLGDNKQTNK